MKNKLAQQALRVFGITVIAALIACNSSGRDDIASADSQAGWTVTIRGKVGFPVQGGQIMIQESLDGGGGWQDTITLKKNYTFEKKVRLSEPGFYKLNFYNRQFINVILDHSDVEVSVDGNNSQGFFEVKGSPDLELITTVQARLQEIEQSAQLAKINQDYRVAYQNGDQKKIADLYSQYQDIVTAEHAKIAKLIEDASPSLAAIYLLQTTTIDKDKFFSTYLHVAEKLKKQWPSYTRSKAFIELVEKMKPLAVGQPAPEIALPDPNGNVVALSSMRGKYVLVDFWAKWCGPCRQENPNVVRVYNKYKDKGFTVFGVSLDRKKEDWLQAIQQDGLTWTHVSDLKYWQSAAAKTYNINSIPFSVLLDPNGIIIDKNLRGPALEKRIAELLDKKP